MSIKTGQQYLAAIDEHKPVVMLKGAQITEKITEHSAFRGVAATQAALYDMQGEDEYREKMTYVCPETGDLVGLSFLAPRTKRDLQKRRMMMSLWASRHHGFLGRSPDYMNTALMAYASAADVLAESNPEYADNLRKYYIYCRENDITLSHAFVQPAASRLSLIMDSFEDTIAAKVHDIGSEGMTVSGAFLLATQAVTSDEILIFPPPTQTDSGESPYTFAFAVPVGSPGMRFVCRESYIQGDSSYDYPLTSRFEEMDTLVLCDRLHVPRHRIFLYGDPEAAQAWSVASQFHIHVSHQTLCRYIAKTEFFLGTVESLMRLGGVTSDSASEQMSEMMVILEVLKSMMCQAEAKARRDRFGNMVPDRNTMLAVNAYFPKVYPRIVEIVQTLTSSRLIMIPSQADFHGPLSSDLDKYLKLFDNNAQDVIALHRLAWEMSAASFAGRQIQYERFFFGGPSAVNGRLMEGYREREQLMESVMRFLRS